MTKYSTNIQFCKDKNKFSQRKKGEDAPRLKCVKFRSYTWLKVVFNDFVGIGTP